MNPKNRIPLSEVERQLGRPCPHERTRDDYCRRCANNAARKRLDARWRQRNREGWPEFVPIIYGNEEQT